jgi:LacI family transcriptional regulator
MTELSSFDATSFRSLTKRVRITELVKETGLSRATIDRAMNGRGGVHAKTRAVIDDTLRRLESRRSAALDPKAADIVLRVGRGLYGQLQSIRQQPRFAGLNFVDMFQTEDRDMLEVVRKLCRDCRRPLILTAKNYDPLNAELVEARKQGKPVIAFVTDLSHDCRDAFAGIDNRMAGQTAAFIIGNLLKHREAKAGVLLGDYAYSAHEDREIGFRSNLRANYPSVQVADVAKGEDSPEQTYDAVRALLLRHPDLDAIYNVAGGNGGLAQALTDSGRAQAVTVITHEVNHITAPLLRAGIIDYAIAQDPTQLLATAVELAAVPATARRKELNFVNFGVYTRFNLPEFAFYQSG